LPGFEVDQVDEYGDLLVIPARSTAMKAVGPDGDQSSNRIHRYYTQEPRDLPSSARKVRYGSAESKAQIICDAI
jgi:hypothetical protein